MGVPLPANVSHTSTKIELKRDIFLNVFKTHTTHTHTHAHTWLLKIIQKI